MTQKKEGAAYRDSFLLRDYRKYNQGQGEHKIGVVLRAPKPLASYLEFVRFYGKFDCKPALKPSLDG